MRNVIFVDIVKRLGNLKNKFRFLFKLVQIQQEYKKIKEKYGFCSSWAIWDENEESNTSVIDDNFSQLNSNHIFVALNISGPLAKKPWLNFHGGKHDRKIKYACNDTILRGSYITDLFKEIEESKSGNLKKSLTEEVIKKNVDYFFQEMKDVGINLNSKFIIFGNKSSFIGQCFDKYFKRYFENEVVYYCHYSYYGISDKKWVEGLWRELKINADFDLIVKKYRT